MRNPPRIVMVKENKNVAPSASTYKRWANTCVHGSIGKIHVPYTTIRVSLKVLLRSTMLKLTINNDKSGEKGGAQKDVQIYWSHVWHINIFSIYQKHVTYHTFPQMCKPSKAFQVSGPMTLRYFSGFKFSILSLSLSSRIMMDMFPKSRKLEIAWQVQTTNARRSNPEAWGLVPSHWQ